ncbi:CidA/LrgA family holin-like protein [Bacillus amyloliquefaciens]|nr:CidA/LrgA family holin-like protein [Bacillus amyloliquefaciens]
MKVIRIILQIIILFAFSFIGGAVQQFFHLPIPGSIIGLILLIICLSVKIIPVKMIEDGAGFLLSFLPLLFIPAMTGVINYPSLFSASGAALFLIIVLSTIVTMIAAGYASQLLEHKANQRKEKRSAASMYRNPYNFVHGRRLSGYGEIICALSISLSHTGFDDYDFHYRHAACFSYFV